jgi:multiple sugar transport system permease protein
LALTCEAILMKKSNRDVANRGLRTVVYFLILAFFLFPILWIFATAFKTGAEFMHTPPIWIPRHPTLTAFAHAIEVGGLGALKNSLIISISATTLSLIVGSLAGYGLARYRLGGDDLPFFILSLRFMPAVAVIFPFLLLFRSLKWMDTYQALIILHLTFNLPYAVWMMRSFFIEVPREIEESALVDGASPFGVFWKISMPLVTPGLIATGVFCFIFSWSEFFFALSLTHTKAVPLSVFLPNFFGKMMVMWGEVGAMSVIAVMPLFVLSVLVQRYLVRGLTMGAVK